MGVTCSGPAAFILLQLQTVTAEQTVLPISTPRHIRDEREDFLETHSVVGSGTAGSLQQLWTNTICDQKCTNCLVKLDVTLKNLYINADMFKYDTTDILYIVLSQGPWASPTDAQVSEGDPTAAHTDTVSIGPSCQRLANINADFLLHFSHQNTTTPTGYIF